MDSGKRMLAGRARKKRTGLWEVAVGPRRQAVLAATVCGLGLATLAQLPAAATGDSAPPPTTRNLPPTPRVDRPSRPLEPAAMLFCRGVYNSAKRGARWLLHA